MLKTYEYRLYPNKEQEVLFAKHFGCARFVYNKILEEKMNTKKGSYSYFCKQITSWKHSDEFSFLKEVSIATLQFAAQHVMNSYNNFFNLYYPKYSKEKDIENRYKRISVRKYKKDSSYQFSVRDLKGYPEFKSLKDRKQSYSVIGHCYVDFDKGMVRIPKFQEGIKARIDRNFEGQVRTCTIKKSKTGKYFISVLVEDGRQYPTPDKVSIEKSLGIDVGLKTLVTCSDGRRFENPRFLSKELSRINFLNKKASKKIKGSNNQRKLYKRIGRIYEKITNKKKDFIHKMTYILTHDNQVSTICMEDLNVEGMLKNHRLSSKIWDAAWSSIRKQFEYKCKWYGKNLVFVNTFYPSSRTCSCCGYIKEDLTLSDRDWVCPKCHVKHDRDLNASINIRNVGIQDRVYP